ncbi:glycosyl transferase [Caldisphaera lagunensis DSM 15908]|uniref:Glycosyl transferase n=1 Tax=Caldisphaera lagunensis (strain DSM 15908 / JCM 11604 / ANMR 0165 / IC-154) TaxID=1056495 RepID=L0AA05_CALLD|nr:glycosyltransferase family 2 protein [Caldisphaera lagunensis]AFZ70686.1 glycosyl transferase [Caldisphaera lagunensis DSM 15908]
MEQINNLNVIIPTLNEEDGIGLTIDEITQYVNKENIIVVDGNSKDNTKNEVEKRGVKFFIQKGKGKAEAIKEALNHVNKEIVLIIDGDYTYPAKYIKEMHSILMNDEEVDEVIGVRNRKNQSIVYRFGNWFLTNFFSLLFGVHLNDVLSGMYMIRKRALEGALFEMRGFSVESEIAAHISSTGNKIAQVNIDYRERKGKKKLGIRHGIKIAIDMLRLSWRYNPVTLFFFVGSLLMIPGLIIGFYTVYDYVFLHIDHFVKAIIALILTATGFQSLMLSILSMYLKRMELRIKSYLNKK